MLCGVGFLASLAEGVELHDGPNGETAQQIFIERPHFLDLEAEFLDDHIVVN